MRPEQGSLPLLAGPRDDTTFTTFRFTNYDVPFWTRENTRASRWNYARDGYTQYWALCPEAAWAELIRYEDLQSEAEVDEVDMPLWVCRLPKRGLLDLRVAAVRSELKVAEEDMVGDDWSVTQALAASLRDRVQGILTPSAALTGHTNVTLFGPRRAIDWHTRPALASTLPATRVAIGRPPPGLVAQVNRRGPSHPSLF